MWHYRLGFTDYPMPDGSTERQYGVVEYYDGGAWTGFLQPTGEDKESLVRDLQSMIDDITQREEEPVEVEEE